MIRGLLRVGAWLSDLAEPWLLLVTRLWLAQAFLVLQVSMLMSGQGLTAAFGSRWWLATLERTASSGAGTLFQALCPTLLALGLLSRPSAVAMLLQVLLFRQTAERFDLGTLWAILLVGLVVLGPGPLSTDRLLMPGLRNSALPGLAAIARAYARMTAIGAPAYLALLRVLTALAVVSPHLRLAPASDLGAMAARAPGIAGVIPHLPFPVAAAAAIALLGGFAVRPIALVLFALAPVGMITIADERLYWLLLLGLLVTRGGGALALDRLVARSLTAMAGEPDRAGLPHVVIVGGGFGGVAAARGLNGEACRVTLIDKRNYHLFQPLLYQVATAGLSPADIATPIRAMFRRQGNLRVLLDEVVGVDAARREVRLRTGTIAFDVLVLATGAQHSYFGRDEWSRLAPGLKTIEDATAVRRRLLSAFEAAENALDEASRRAWQTFVVVGGGPTGVELAGAIAELARFGMEGEFNDIDPAESRVVLVQSGPVLLPAFPKPLSEAAAASLTRMGVEIRLNGKAEAIDASGVTIGGALLPARTVLWAAGVMASPAAQWLGVHADRSGRIEVGPDLSVPGYPDVFAIGDTVVAKAWKGRPAPGIAPAAKQGGAHVARVIAASLRRRPSPPAFRYRHFGNLATIGRRAAVADFGLLRFHGAIAWWLWGAAHIVFLIGGRNRAGVIVAWLWDYFTYRRGTRLITGTSVAD